ncbi:MAG: hypothetical protein KDN20_13835 [Verrucomicrobiae bacterium]|nr:hypothetical protein [Verrucomicrobiae bacterium]
MSPALVAADLIKVEQDLLVGDSRSLSSAEKRINTLESLLPSFPRTPDLTKIQISFLTAKAHLQRAQCRYDDSVILYDQALTKLNEFTLDRQYQDRQKANLWTCRGIGLLGAKAWQAAIQSFDQAIAIRRRSSDSGAHWGLAAALINRGEALGKLGGDANWTAAVEAQEQAIDALAIFAFEKNPGIANRLALAWMNRGEALAQLTEKHGADRASDSMDSYDKASQILEPLAGAGHPDSARVLAVILANGSRARLRFSHGAPEVTAQLARRALLLVADQTNLDRELLEVVLTASLTLCRSLLQSEPSEDLDAEITEIADSALSTLAARWQYDPEDETLVSLASEVFLCGADAYLRYQPHFLTDYLLDQLDPDRSPAVLSQVEVCHEAAVRILWRGLGEFQRAGFADIGSERFDSQLSRQTEWQQCRERLKKVRQKVLP